MTAADDSATTSKRRRTEEAEHFAGDECGKGGSTWQDIRPEKTAEGTKNMVKSTKNARQ